MQILKLLFFFWASRVDLGGGVKCKAVLCCGGVFFPAFFSKGGRGGGLDSLIRMSPCLLFFLSVESGKGSAVLLLLIFFSFFVFFRFMRLELL